MRMPRTPSGCYARDLYQRQRVPKEQGVMAVSRKPSAAAAKPSESSGSAGARMMSRPWPPPGPAVDRAGSSPR